MPPALGPAVAPAHAPCYTPRMIRRSILGLLTITLFGCPAYFSASTRLPHPARADGVIIDARIIQENTPPDEATLSRLTPEEVCFDVALRGGPRYSRPSSWTLGVLVDGNTNKHIENPRLMPLASEPDAPPPPACTRRNRRGECLESAPVAPTRHTEAAVRWRACFDNPGYITPRTRTITLEMDAADQLTHNMHFVWELF